MFQMRANIVCVVYHSILLRLIRLAGHLGTPFTRALRAGRE